MKSDIEISRQTKLLPISEIAKKVDIPTEELIPYGKYIAKLPLELLTNKDKSENQSNELNSKSNLILVTAITPTKAGVGKTTTSVGLGLGLAKIGKKAIVALREPSLGPCFGMKGGAAGGGYAQVLPMENINLHFTGDFHAITSANNMISALLDNYQFQNKGSDRQLNQILWKRVLDVNDRSLRNVITGLGGISNGIPTETGFDITPASEIMAILCLSTDLDDLKTRIGNILLGYRKGQEPVFVKDLGFQGAITVLLKDAIQPNLVQTTENTASIIHGGPFANIAHGCNSVLATKMALNFADYVVTEAGFGADLGAEKFINIKCRKSGLSPKVTVIVATSQALKLHGKVAESEIKKPNLEGIKEGTKNLEKHIENMQSFGQSVVVAFNKYDFDTDEEIEFLKEFCSSKNVKFAINNGFLEGGKGAEELAKAVVEVCQNNPSKPLTFTYENEDDIETKIKKVAQKIYGANGISFSDKAQKMLSKINNLGFSNFPICIAKTQYSFSDDAQKLGVAKDFTLHIEDLVINSGAGFIVAVSGTIMRMPGLPKEPQALQIDIKDGFIEGLS